MKGVNNLMFSHIYKLNVLSLHFTSLSLHFTLSLHKVLGSLSLHFTSLPLGSEVMEVIIVPFGLKIGGCQNGE